MKFLFILTTVLLSACITIPNNENTIATYGYVKYVELEGGFYGIVSEGGTQYKPSNLQPRFHRNDIRIYFEAKVTPSQNEMGIQMWGKPVFITKISEE